MARPAVTHDGFLIPNASGVAQPVLAEPDQIDFNTLANAQWGVIEGCTVNSQSAKTVAITAGTAIVNGKLVVVTAGQLPLPTPGVNAQFVLVVVDDGGVLKLNTSAPASVDPVFPDPLANETVLASVYCDSSSASFANNIVDKRKLLSKALLTKIATTAELVRNANNTGNHYLVTGDGKTAWEGDTFISRSGAKTLRVEDNLQTVGNVSTVNLAASGTVAATGKISGSNFTQGTALPASATDGDLFMQTSTGNLYVWFAGAWSQFASMSATQGVVPIGTVIFSMQDPNLMRPLGWYPLNGTEQLSEATHGTIFTIDTGGTVTGTAPNRTMTLPDLNRRTLIVDYNSPHQFSGLAKNLLTLTEAQMPKHNHQVGGNTFNPGRTSAAGAHTPAVNITAGTGTHGHTVTGGYHDHPVYDPGHAHNGMDWYGVSAAVIGWVGFSGTPQDGKNKIDAMFNDSSHTYTVEPIRWTMKATTGIDIGPNYEHTHSLGGGGHDHSLTTTPVLDHYHTVSEIDVGSGKAIDITPLNFTVYAYIRA